jgi:hypothetical protein
MPIDDALEKALQQYASEALVTGQDVALDAAINAVPVAGSSIAALFSGLARRRIRERLVTVLNLMKAEIESVGEKSVCKEFFDSEEFQTLFSMVLEQLQTTHDHEKLRLLAMSLAHSGFNDFSAENRKELFIRAIRDLTPIHIDFLSELLPDYSKVAFGWSEEMLFRERPAKANYTGVSLMLIQHLLALGFVEELLKEKNVPSLSASGISNWKISEINKMVSEFVEKPHERTFRISTLGQDFLRFLGVGSRTKWSNQSLPSSSAAQS